NADKKVLGALKTKVSGMIRRSEEPSAELTQAVARLKHDFLRDVGIEVDTAKVKGSKTVAEIPRIHQLPNRQKLESDLTLELQQAHPTGVLFIDLDGFKGVNDTLGHAAGDQCLAKVVELIGNSVVCKGTLYRIGGDEFAVICLSRTSEFIEFIESYI